MLDMKLPVKTVSGKKVRIYNKDYDRHQAIHGAIYENDSWVSCSWDISGSAYPIIGFKKGERDIVNVQALEWGREPFLGEFVMIAGRKMQLDGTEVCPRGFDGYGTFTMRFRF